MSRLFLLLIAIVFLPLTAAAQNAAAPPPKEPPLRRWFEIQTFTLSTRYRFIDTNADRTTSNDMQYREYTRARFNLDAKKRFTVNFGTASGNSFISSWDYTGWGINDADYHNHYLKHLYGSAIPISGLEIQAGGLYISKGELTEFTSYDDDGYVMGSRVTVRRPKQIYLDEVTFTRASLGPSNEPNVFDRFEDFDDPNYTQILASKRFSQMVAASLDFSEQSGADTLRGAVALRFKPTAPITALRYEQYHRFNANSASGFALTAERPVTKWVRLSGGYATIDEFYGGLNADRIQRGRRFFAIANVPLVGPLSASFFVTEALHADYALSNQTRFDAVLAWDVLNSLKRTGHF